MIAIVELKGNGASTSIFGIIISKLSYRQVPSSILLLLIDKSLKIYLHYIILPIGFAICIQIKSDRELPPDVKEVT